jgi:hypothetical protein
MSSTGCSITTRDWRSKSTIPTPAASRITCSDFATCSVSASPHACATSRSASSTYYRIRRRRRVSSRWSAASSIPRTSPPIGISCYGWQRRSAPARRRARPCSRSCRLTRVRTVSPRRCARSAGSSARCSRSIGSRTPPSAAVPSSASTRAKRATRWPGPSISQAWRNARSQLREPVFPDLRAQPAGRSNHPLEHEVSRRRLCRSEAPGPAGHREPVAARGSARLGAHRPDRRLRVERRRAPGGRFATPAAPAPVAYRGLSSLIGRDVVHSEHFRVVTPYGPSPSLYCGNPPAPRVRRRSIEAGLRT